MNKCIILSGIPCSGKSKWATKQGLSILSCDSIRKELFGKNYKQNSRDEKVVWSTFYQRLQAYNQDLIEF